MNYGFIKACAVSPALRVADCPYNAQKTIEAMQQAAEDGCQLTVFPELGLTGYTCGDLFLQQPLLDAAEAALREILKASEALQLVALVGLPVTVDAKLYNCAAVICQGALLGLVPKSHIPNYGEFYEKRHYCAAPAGVKEISFAGQKTLFGTKLLFRCETMQAFTLAVEICEDLWAPLPPSTAHALAGATVIANLSASDETVGKAEYRRALVSQQSARLLCAYLYADAGHGESTTDMVFSGHNLIAENGALLAESRPFSQALACIELDLGRLLAERRRNTSFEPVTDGYETVSFHLPLREIPLTRYISPTPFVPADGGARAERCELILQMQADGLAKRIEHAHAKTAVIGISGGLDSCLALLVAVHAMKKLDRSMDSILAVTMPCFGTTKRTRSNAEILCQELGVQFTEISIANTVRSHFADIGQSETNFDVTFENGQARVRTLELMDLANRTGGLVVGTGDLSELALGWATYNGDHMSMYGVNAGVPKTLCAMRRTQQTATRCARSFSTFSIRPSPPSSCPQRKTARLPSRRSLSWVPTSCTTSIYITCCASASRLQRSTIWQKLRCQTGTPMKCSCTGSETSTAASSSSSSSAAACLTVRRSARSRSRPEATGACRLMPA